MVGFPLLLIPLAIYNIVAWLMPDVPLTDPMFRLTLMSGAQWTITLSDILLTVGLLLLLLEIFKGARPGSKYLTDHLLSFVVFGAAAAEFVMLPKFGTSTFFLLSLMAMVDFFGGIALRARRRMATPAVSRKVPARVEAAKPEPPVEPAHETPVPAGAGHSAASAASVAESVLLDHPKPDQSRPDQSKPATAQTTGEASPTVPSPELQPGPNSAPEAPQR
jgi:hypothetical protein